MKIIDGLKFGFGLYFGYELAKKTNEILGIIYTEGKKRIKEGY